MSRWSPSALAALLLATAGLSEAARLEITVTPRYQGDPLQLDSLRYQNASGESLAVTRLSYLLSGFALQQEDGSWLELPDTNAWLDAATRRHSLTLDAVPPARYRALRFHVGPDAATNAADPSRFPATHPLNPNLNGLHWSWQQNYIFMALEGHFRPAAAAGSTAEPQGFTWHFARDPNRTPVTLSANLDLHKNAGILIHFNISSLLHAPRALSFARDGTATHSRDGDPLAAALKANLPAAFHVQRIATASPAIPAAAPLKPIDLPDHFTPFPLTISRSFPIPDLPLDNPLITERVNLGRQLFHDPLLSRDGTISCASCHAEKSAFTDGLPVSIGVDGRKGDRNAMPLFNLAWKQRFFWDGRAPSLRAQVLMPIADHREMDLTPESAATTLSNSPEYPDRFRAAFKSPGITPQKIALALEQYLLTLVSSHSKFDLALLGRATLTPPEQRGLELFMTESDPRTDQRGADCFHCHGGPLFTDHQFHDNGLANPGPGLSAVTGNPADSGKFVTPSLRNLARTAPYMHDGRFASLEAVVTHYTTGIHRNPSLDPNLAKHPAQGLQLSASEQRDLIAFLLTLTDLKP
jgi:cytochrome c peroxidase